MAVLLELGNSRVLHSSLILSKPNIISSIVVFNEYTHALELDRCSEFADSRNEIEFLRLKRRRRDGEGDFFN
jgi:hypothetical protein